MRNVSHSLICCVPNNCFPLNLSPTFVVKCACPSGFREEFNMWKKYCLTGRNGFTVGGEMISRRKHGQQKATESALLMTDSYLA